MIVYFVNKFIIVVINIINCFNCFVDLKNEEYNRKYFIKYFC